MAATIPSVSRPSQLTIAGAPNAAIAVPMFPIPYTPSANPWRSFGYQPATNGTPTANDEPAMPRKNPTTTRAAYPSTKPKIAAGIADTTSTIGNITRPPRRSVSAPTGIRSSEPSTTGTAVSISVLVFVRSRSSWNRFASGAIRLQPTNATANATVARNRFRVARAGPTPTMLGRRRLTGQGKAPRTAPWFLPIAAASASHRSFGSTLGSGVGQTGTGGHR